MNQKKEDSRHPRGGGLLGAVIVVVVLWVGWLSSWWEANRDTVSEILEIVRLVVWWAALGWVLWIVPRLVWGWWSRRSGRAGGKRVGDGWDPGGRAMFAVVPVRGGRRQPGMGPKRGKGGGVVELWSWLLRHTGGLDTVSGRVARVLWTHGGDGKLVWGLSVDREIERSVKRAVAEAWPETVIEPWPLDGRVEVSDGVPVGEGGGAVVRRLLAPRVLTRPLNAPSEGPDHPMAPIGDIMADHPEVDVQLVVDVVALSPSERARVCEERLEGLDDHDPDRGLWETDDRRGRVEGVRVLLRVSRRGPGHRTECERVADRVCRVLDTHWATDYNRLATQKVSDERFDEMWDRGTVGSDLPAFHWDSLAALLAPPPPSIGKSTTGKRWPDPPVLETFYSQAPEGWMPIGVLSENGTERMVAVPWGGPTDPLVDWTVGATGSGKTWHAVSRVIALAETGWGFLFLDPHRTAVRYIKQFLGSRHADRIVEIDLQATDRLGTPISAGWNPLDLTVVSEELRRGRIDTLKGMLPVALFPTYFTDGKSPQTATILRKALECLLSLNYHLPPELQANIFCIENVLLDEEWRNLAISRLPARDQKWWHHTYPMIVGSKGPTSAALKPALNALEQWKTQDRVQALLGASQTTLRWRDIIDGGKILFVTLNNDRSETDNLLARLIVGEMIAAFKERSLTHNLDRPVRPFHLFLDEFQSYAPVLEAQAEVMTQELRKYGAKVHFINQSPSVLSPKMREIIAANRTHIFAGRLGNPKDAEYIAKAMGGQPQRVVRSPQEPQPGPSPVDSRDLLGMPRWHFLCQITQNGEPSPAFQLKGINADQAWAHLKTRNGEDITRQIAENTGLEPIDKRLDHYDTLPDRIAHWLQTTQHQHSGSGTSPTSGTMSAGSYSNHPTGPTDQPPTGSFQGWVNDCATDDPDAVTPTARLTVSYTRYCDTQNIEPLPGRSFQELLTRRYGPSETVRVNGKVTRVRRGIKLPNTQA